RRDLSERLRHRPHRGGREERPRLQAHRRAPGGRLHEPRGGAGGLDPYALARGAGGHGMKAAGAVLAIVLALALQTTVARFVIRGIVAVDLVLVVVVYVALNAGPVTGLLSGTFAGLVQDTLAGSGIIGIGGLAKTIVGFLTGIVGTQFIVVQ